MIIVDDRGNADFTDIQEAINCVSTNQGKYSNGIIIMPGWYNIQSPLQFPTNTSISLRGAGANRQNVEINNTNGAVIELSSEINLNIANLTIAGTPALQHNGTSGWFKFDARNCEFRRSQNQSSSPTLVLNMDQGDIKLQECNIMNNEQGGAVQISGNGTIFADHCSFRSEDNASNNKSERFAAFSLC